MQEINGKKCFNILKWTNKIRVNPKQRITNFSISKKLKEEQRLTKEAEIVLNNLSLEEIIGLKLELSARSFGTMCFGMPILASLKNIVEDATIKYVWCMAGSNKEKFSFLGVSPLKYYKLIYKYQPERYFFNNPIRFDKAYLKLRIRIAAIRKNIKRKFGGGQ